ncbi:hypothetical protein Tco_0541305 [Tanacetum coccineum]
MSSTKRGRNRIYRAGKLTLALVYAARRLQRGRNSNKGQILADFLAEITTMESIEKETQNARNEDLDPENAWKLYTDGASNSDGSGA